MGERQMMLSEALLNPSVEPEDEIRLDQQFRRMRRLFFARGRMGFPVSTVDLTEIAAQYNARLWELRQWLIPLGLCIDLVRKGAGGVNYYAIVSLENSTYYAERKGKI